MTQQRIEIALTNPLWRLVIAIVLGVGAMFCLLQYQDYIFLQNSGGRRVKVVVARSELAPGDRISHENIGTQEIPVAYVHANALLSDHESEVLGRKVFRKIPQNSFLQWTDLDDPHEDASDAARTVAPERGMRAAAVPLGPMLSKARMLRKGDNIDVIVHFQLGDQGNLTMTLFQNVYVLEQEDGFALIALSPEQTEQLAFAQAHGTLTVALRNRLDLEKKQIPTVSIQNFIKDYTGPQPAPTGKPSPTAASHNILHEALEKLAAQKGKKAHP